MALLSHTFPLDSLCSAWAGDQRGWSRRCQRTEGLGPHLLFYSATRLTILRCINRSFNSLCSGEGENLGVLVELNRGALHCKSRQGWALIHYTSLSGLSGDFISDLHSFWWLCSISTPNLDPKYISLLLGFHQPVYTKQGCWAASSVDRKTWLGFSWEVEPNIVVCTMPFSLSEYISKASPRVIAWFRAAEGRDGFLERTHAVIPEEK